MATLYIAEFGTIQAYPTEDTAQIAKFPPITTQAIALSSTASVTSAPLNANTQIVRIWCDAQFWLTASAIGTTIATAVATSIPFGAQAPEYLGVMAGYRNGTTQVLAALSSA